MKLIISSQGQKLESPIESRFGRSPWLIMHDSETNESKAFVNPGVSQSGGAGVAAAQFVIDQAADIVISGDFGPHAANALRAGKVKMYLFDGNLANVGEAVDTFLKGKLPAF
jgi:predicted Fe-Mo cluster-binding NifX family protein